MNTKKTQSGTQADIQALAIKSIALGAVELRPDEYRLIRAFRNLHIEVQELIVDTCERSAKNLKLERVKPPVLTLVVGGAA